MSIIDEDGEIDLGLCAEEIANQFDSDVWLYSGPINDYGLGEVIKQFPSIRKYKNAILILVTNGGSANAGYQIANLFQEFYESFYLFIPSYCKSAGTLIACGANRLYMDVFSELGPLDVQLKKRNEIAVDKSGLLSGSTFDALMEATFETFQQFMLRITLSSGGQISFSLAAELSSKMTTALMSGIYSQMDPDVIGSDHRDLNVAMQYGLRLAAKADNCTPTTVMDLVRNYPSHDFIIDADEAAELFGQVEEPPALFYVLTAAIGNSAYDEAPRPLVMNFTSDDGAEEVDEDEMAPDAKTDRSSDPEPAVVTEGRNSDSDAGSEEEQAGAEPNRRP